MIIKKLQHIFIVCTNVCVDIISAYFFSQGADYIIRFETIEPKHRDIHCL